MARDKLPLRLAFCQTTGFFYRFNNSQRASGPISDIFNAIYPPYFNITFIEDGDGCILGNRGPNGSYNGVIGKVQRGEADTMVMIATTDLEGEPVKFSPVFGSAIGRIMTKQLVDDGKSYIPDLLESFKAFDSIVWTVIVLACFIIATAHFAIVRKHPDSKRFMTLDIIWHPLRVLLDQDDINVELDQLKALFVCFGSAIFILQEVFRNLLSTDLVITKKIDNIDSLDDLLRTNQDRPLQPLFVNTYPIMSKFEFAKEGSVREKVWKLTSIESNQSRVLDVSVSDGASFQNFVRDMSNDKFALISHSIVMDPMFTFHCSTVDVDKRSDCATVKRHISKEPFLETGYALGVSQNIRQDVQDMFAKSIYNVFEIGIGEFWNRDLPTRLLRYLTELTTGPGKFVDDTMTCARCLELPDPEPSPPAFEVIVSNIRHFSKVLAAMLIGAVILLHLERFASRKKKKIRRRKRRLRKSNLAISELPISN